MWTIPRKILIVKNNKATATTTPMAIGTTVVSCVVTPSLKVVRPADKDDATALGIFYLSKLLPVKEQKN